MRSSRCSLLVNNNNDDDGEGSRKFYPITTYPAATTLSLEVDIVPKRYYFVMMMWKEVWVFVLSLFAAGCGGGKSDVAPLASSSRSTDDGTVHAKNVPRVRDPCRPA